MQQNLLTPAERRLQSTSCKLQAQCCPSDPRRPAWLEDRRESSFSGPLARVVLRGAHSHRLQNSPPSKQSLFGSLLPLRASQPAVCTASPPVASPELAHHFFITLHIFSFISVRVVQDPSASLGVGRPLVFRPSTKSKGEQQQSEL